MLTPYLTFNGNCRQALQFYQACFGGTLSIQMVGDVPAAEPLDPDTRALVLHAELSSSSIKLMATDMVPEEGILRGNVLSLLIDCEEERQFRQFFRDLGRGGQPVCAPQLTYFGALFAGLIDQYGITWYLNCRNV